MLVVVVLLVSVKMAPAWRSVTLSPFSTFTQGTVSHKAQGHTKNTVTCTCSHTKHTVTQAPYKVHLTQSTQSYRPTSHKAQSHMHTITHLTQSTQSHRHHTKYTSHKAQSHRHHTKYTSHKAHSHTGPHHTRHSHTCTPPHTSHKAHSAPYKVHLTQSTQSHRPTSHKAQSHMHTITQGTKSHHHTKHRITQDTQVN